MCNNKTEIKKTNINVKSDLNVLKFKLIITNNYYLNLSYCKPEHVVQTKLP